MSAPLQHLRSLAAPRFLGPASRVAMGLVALMVMLLLLGDLFFHGFLPDTGEQARRERRLATQLLASRVVQSLQARGGDDLGGVLAAALQQEPAMRSAAVVAFDGRRVSAGPHGTLWHLAPDAPSTADHMRSVLTAGDRPWGELQVSFEPALPDTLPGLLRLPLVQGFLLIVTLGFVAFQLYLRRAMVYLDPSRVVPDRVRAALDTLSESVLILDPQFNVLLANRAFRELLPTGTNLTGRPVESLAWLANAAGRLEGGAPWQAALKHNQAQIGARLRLDVTGNVRHVIVNCSPINAGGGAARGCLLTMTDVTDLHERTEHLRAALVELEASKDEIRQKNDELLLLATRDPLTGCLNRRAFAADSAPLVEAAIRDGRPVSCVMCDIDHFKRVNDSYGHAGGDLVLQATAKVLGRGLRTGDLLARFGGEEFCILLTDTSLAQARDIAERLRADVEAHAGQALRQLDGVRVTMSFGIEQLGLRQATLHAVTDLADQALYHSKKSGRNRVTAYPDIPVDAAP